MNLPAPQFQAIQEPDAFLHLFPHRFDFLYAAHPDPGDRPNWKTEDRHPLSDRLLQEGAYLYGVRFGKQTDYLLLDIDAGSLYHPQRDRLAISRLLAALEPLGLVETVAITSSYSGGIHLYLPFQQAQETWAIARSSQSSSRTKILRPETPSWKAFQASRDTKLHEWVSDPMFSVLGIVPKRDSWGYLMIQKALHTRSGSPTPHS